LPNVHWLGEKPVGSLPSYVQHFDVCMQCYEVNAYTRYIYPLKLNEYLATGRPTISSPIDAVQALTGIVTIAHSDAEWIAAIDEGLTKAANTSTAAEARRAVARTNNWDELVDRIAKLFPNDPPRFRETLAATGLPA